MTEEKTIEELKAELAREDQKHYSPFSLLGYVFGGISLLNLVNEFKLIKLYGLVKNWADAFKSFILGIRDFLFGWIDISWMKITDIESYFLVISFLFVSSFARAVISDFSLNPENYDAEKYNNTTVRITSSIFLYVSIFLFVSIFSLLLPNILTLPVLSMSVIFLSIYILFPSGKKNELRAIIKARANLKGSFLVFLLLVALNYGLQA